jgi:beta-glucosidase
VQEPPFNTTPLPPQPYPLPNDPPPLYPDFYTISPKDILPGYKFPRDFLFGWATAAQQWEGAVKADGKGPTIWVGQFRWV